MRIISKFRDYYDSAVAWRDETLCYVRKEAVFDFKKDLSPEQQRAIADAVLLCKKLPQCNWAHRHVIAFCGELFPCYVTEENETFYGPGQMDKEYSRRSPPESDDGHWVDKKLWVNRIKALSRSDNYKPWKMNWQDWQNRNDLTYKSWTEFVKRYPRRQIDAEPFRLFNAPVFEVFGSFSRIKVVVNPYLKGRNFACQVDPYTAFQELSLFIGNDLVEQMDPNIERTDEMIRDSKGMDEWSFRKMGKNSKRKK